MALGKPMEYDGVFRDPSWVPSRGFCCLQSRGALMLTFWGRGQTFCDGVHRRDFLRLGALGLGGFTLADLLRHEARAGGPARPKSIIYIVLNGGPSHIDMYDLKPDAPAEF